MVMRWFVAILIEKMSHTVLPWLPGLMVMRWIVAMLVEKISHTALPWLPAFRCHESACCDSGRINESHRITMLTGLSYLYPT